MNLIPSYILKIAQKLHQNNFEAYLVGGSLRDILLNTEPNDYDIATNALPEDIVKIFPKSVPTGAKYGTVIVLAKDEETGAVENVEVTTYRKEKDYVGGRWPSHVEFSTSIVDDLKRRDFTVNAIALNLNMKSSIVNWQLEKSEKGLVENPPRHASHIYPSQEGVLQTGKLLNSQIENFIDDSQLMIEHLLDPFNGQIDLKNKIIRAVGDPIERFKEDGLRPMRACRLASILGFTIEEETFKAITETLEVASIISKERIRDEFYKLVINSLKPSIGIELMRKSGLLQLYIPELLEGYGMEQNQYHVHDVYQHLLDTVDVAPKEIRMAALFHDIGKARTKDGEHFYEHDQVGAQITKEVLTRLRFPRQFIDETVKLVRWHMFYVPEVKIRNEELRIKNAGVHNIEDKKKIRDEMFEEGWSDGTIRRLIQHVGGHENIDNLIKLRIADAVANPTSSFNPTKIQLLAERIAEIREQESLLSTRDLQIDGHDVMALGITGPKIKEVMEYLLEKVNDDIELNQKEILLALVKEYFNNLSKS